MGNGEMGRWGDGRDGGVNWVDKLLLKLNSGRSRKKNLYPICDAHITQKLSLETYSRLSNNQTGEIYD